MKTEVHTENELRIFVYGTLKKGFSNHESYCPGVLRIMKASIRGKLFKLTPDIPVMSIPACDILARGSGDPAKDMRLQARFGSDAGGESGAWAGLPKYTGRGAALAAEGAGLWEPAGSWKTINGELLFFGDPETRLPLIDGLEEFRPGEQSSYLRVLVHVALADGSTTAAWTYIAGFDTEGLEHYEGENWFPDEQGRGPVNLSSWSHKV